MASCDDDFSLLGDDNAVTTTTTTTTNTNPNPNYHHQQAFANKYKPPTAHLNADDDVVSADGDGYSDSALNNNTSSFHVVSVNPYGNDSNPYETEPDLSKNRVNISTEKRTDREEVSDSGTPYPYKRSKLNSSSAVSGGGGGGEYRKDREEWSDTAIACLLEAYMEKFMQLNRGNLRGRDWEEVAAMVSERCEKQTKSVEQCKNKVDNLKKRYKLERHRLSNGGISASHWPWFKQMDQIVGNSPSGKAAVADDEKAGGGSTNSTRQSKRYCVCHWVIVFYSKSKGCSLKRK